MLLALAAPLVLEPAHPLGISAALADDDDDDGGDDDDDDGGSWSGGDDDDDDGFWGGDDDDDRPRAAPVVRAPAPPPPPLLTQAPDEIVVDSLGDDDLARLEAEGFQVISRDDDDDGRLTLLRVPGGVDVPGALAAVAGLVPTLAAAPNSYYRNQAVPDGCDAAICEAWQAVAWPPAQVNGACHFAPHIGIVDTGVNLEHDMLRDAQVTVETLGSAGAAPSGERHGTAVVAMFVGDATGRVPGLAPAAQLFVVDPFGNADGDERADTVSLVSALDRMVETGVDVINLSLAGPDNPLLAAAVARVDAAGIPIVAAVGNDGPNAGPVYPAAYPQVIAATAVDAEGRIYRRAVQGEHVHFAAPGVEIATAASISGVRPQTGTSFAAPFVTTAIAAGLARNGEESVAPVVEALARDSIDLGDPGRDPVYGWGLVQIPSPC
ncbi:hypothetical protein VE25_02910 [Devosia geojensis]|uniref:Peptidase S8/S53 domain-containing protein n=1 Tax=Devosia geojensis TaxID=443610 RepID=A0A0F5FYK8_9HYPH|nr:hypothetical protein VE25_02910 [Devosia geojensis]